MPLLFHATNYSPERAQAEIQRLLLSVGARRVSLDYDPSTRMIVGMSFTLVTGSEEHEFMLPVRVDRVKAVLQRQGVLRGAGRRPDPALAHQHAASVAWRTLLEWMKVQLAIIETDQAKADEIMLPYLQLRSSNGTGTISLYEQFSSDRALPAG